MGYPVCLKVFNNRNGVVSNIYSDRDQHYLVSELESHTYSLSFKLMLSEIGCESLGFYTVGCPRQLYHGDAEDALEQ